MHFPRHRVIDWGHSSKWEIQRERGDCCTLLSCPNLIYIQHLPEDGLRSVYFYCFGQWLHVCALDMKVYRLRFIQMDRWRYGGKMISSWGTMSLADLLSGTTPMTPGRRQSFAWLKFRQGRWEHERIAVVCLADAGIWPLRSFQQPWVLWICGEELSDNVSGPEPTSNHQTTDCQKARSSYEVVTNAQWANNIARPIAFQMLGMQDKWHQTTSTDMHRVRERRLELNWVQWNSSAASYCAFIRPLIANSQLWGIQWLLLFGAFFYSSQPLVLLCACLASKWCRLYNDPWVYNSCFLRVDCVCHSCLLEHLLPQWEFVCMESHGVSCVAR